MTNVDEFLQQLERDVSSLKAASDSTCRAFSSLPSQTRVAYAESLRFLGCKNVETPCKDTYIVPGPHRIRAAKVMLLSLYLDTDSPAWSSYTLDRLLGAVMNTPGGNIGDLFHALTEILCDGRLNLTEYVANLIKTLVIKSFTEHRSSCESSDLGWMVRSTTECPTPATAYLALLAIPPGFMNAECAHTILHELASTAYFEEAMITLEDALDSREYGPSAEVGEGSKIRG